MDGRVTNGASLPLQGIMKRLGHSRRALDVLKVDCEGCEWEELPGVFNAMSQGSLQVAQWQAELHNMRRKTSLETVDRFFKSAREASLFLFAKEPNIWGDDCTSGNAQCVEIALVHVGHAKKEFIRRTCPGASF